MPVLFQICVEGNTGSTGRSAEEIGNLAIQKGWGSYIAFGRFPRPSNSHSIRIESNWGVYLHGLKTRLFDQHCLGSVNATRKLVRNIERIKPDIIHLHHLHGYYINIKILFEYLANTTIPVVWTFHDCWSFTGHCAHFDHIGCEKWKTECNHCPQKKEYPSSYLLDRSRKNFIEKRELFNSIRNLTIISVSRWLDEKVRVSFLSEKSRKVIYNGIDTDLFRPELKGQIKKKFNIEDKFIILGVASPWTAKKGLYDFIELSKRLDTNDIIILIGLNKNQIRKLPLGIIGLPRTENQIQLKEFYNSADIYMNLSVEETFGLTTAEALSCGIPSIVYNSTACPEIVDENTGFIIEKHQLNDLMNAIDVIKKRGKHFYSIACRQRVVRLYNKKQKFEEYFSLYMNLLRKTK